MSRVQRGFTLVELLVVIAIIGVLIGMTVPAISAVRARAQMSACSNNVGQVVKAMASYESLNQTYPPGRVGCDADQNEMICKNLKGYQRTATSGFALILPQLDEKQLYDRLGNFRKGAFMPEATNDSDGGTKNWQGTLAAGAFSARPKAYVCPSSRAGSLVWVNGQPTGNPNFNYATGTYAMCMGSLGPNRASTQPAEVAYRNNGMFGFKIARPSSAMLDGASQTFLIGEATHATSSGWQNAWLIATLLRHSLRSTEQYVNNTGAAYIRETDGKPKEGEYIRGVFASAHHAGAFFGFGDQHVQFINTLIDHRAYNALATRAGAEVIKQNATEDWEWVAN